MMKLLRNISASNKPLQFKTLFFSKWLLFLVVAQLLFAYTKLFEIVNLILIPIVCITFLLLFMKDGLLESYTKIIQYWIAIFGMYLILIILFSYVPNSIILILLVTHIIITSTSMVRYYFAIIKNLENRILYFTIYVVIIVLTFYSSYQMLEGIKTALFLVITKYYTITFIVHICILILILWFDVIGSVLRNIKSTKEWQKFLYIIVTLLSSDIFYGFLYLLFNTSAIPEIQSISLDKLSDIIFLYISFHFSLPLNIEFNKILLDFNSFSFWPVLQILHAVTNKVIELTFISYIIGKINFDRFNK